MILTMLIIIKSIRQISKFKTFFLSSVSQKVIQNYADKNIWKKNIHIVRVLFRGRSVSDKFV